MSEKIKIRLFLLLMLGIIAGFSFYFPRGRRQVSQAEAFMTEDLREAVGGASLREAIRDGSVEFDAIDVQGKYEKELDEWFWRIEKLQVFADAFPELTIPEMKYLKESDWLEATRGVELDSEVDYRKALAKLRFAAKKESTIMLGAAVRRASADSEIGEIESINVLAGFLPADFDGEILERFRIARGAIDGGPRLADNVLLVEDPVDSVWDSVFWISENGNIITRFGLENGEVKVREAINEHLSKVGKMPTSGESVRPYIDDMQIDGRTLELIFNKVQEKGN